MQAPGVIQTCKGTGVGWCVDGDGSLVTFRVGADKRGRRPNRVRCPYCKRRLKVQTFDCEEMAPHTYTSWGTVGEPAYRVPIHKVPKKKRRPTPAAPRTPPYPGDAVAREAFDVMMRRGWGVSRVRMSSNMWAAFGVNGWVDSRGEWPATEYADPLTALLGAEKWRVANVESKSEAHPHA